MDMIKNKVNFHRYFSDESLHFSYDLPQKFIDKYPNALLNTTARYRIWQKDRTKTPISIDGKIHILNDLIRDMEFFEDVQNSLTMESYTRIKFRKSWNRRATNFFISFTNSEDGGKPRKSPSAKKSPKTPRAKKVANEKKSTFKQLKRKLKSKIQYIQKMHSWKDNEPTSEHYDKTGDNYGKISEMIFNSYKNIIEENLDARNIKYIIGATLMEQPGSNYSTPDKFVEYILVDNTENIPEAVLKKQVWDKLYLTWYTTKRAVGLGSRYKAVICSTKKIGLSLSNSPLFFSRRLVKSFNSMRESAFTDLVEQSYKVNNDKYNGNIENFKSVEERMKNNLVELEKMKNFLSEKIIPHVDKKHIENMDFGFDKTFYIKFNNPNDHWKSFPFMKLEMNIDKDENLNIALTLLNLRQFNCCCTEEVIQIFTAVFNDDISSSIETINRTLSA